MIKLFDVNSIRSRMVAGFLFLTFLLLVLAVVSLHIVDRTSRVARIHGTINQLEILTLNLIKVDNDFFDLELINETYFKNHKSIFLQTRDSLTRRVKAELDTLLYQTSEDQPGVNEQLAAIDSTLLLYNAKFNRLEELAFRKGFKDFGVEGAMRAHAHELEERSAQSFTSGILYLRRHEKDFLLRNDTSYVSAFNERFTSLLMTMQRQATQNAYSIYHLKQYKKRFVELAEIQKQLGLSSKHGLRAELNSLTFSLSDQYFKLSEFSYTQAMRSYSDARAFYIILLTSAVFFSVVSGYWISKKLSEPIARLSRVVNNAIAAKTTLKTDFSLRNAANEINTLAGSFNQLMNQTKNQLSEIKRKSKLLKEKNRQLKKLNNELDNFLYSTAHDLRSPLTSLLGLIHIMRMENKQEELTDYFNRMEKSIHRLESFISQIVSYSQNKRLKIQSEQIDLNQLVSEVLENHQFINGFNKIQKFVIVQGHAPLFSDRNRLTILFNNLISNAIKYADLQKSEPFIKIKAAINAEEMYLEFADNGIGIGKPHLDKIFDMFYRANHYSKGSGLGLFIFRETVRRMKGNVMVESEEMIGTKFFVRIPNLYAEAVRQDVPFAQLA